MKFNPDLHRRQSIRLRGYDYSCPGLYFITVCSHQGQPMFGQVVNGVMQLNVTGMMVERWWNELMDKFPAIRLHEHVIMPNHIHGVIEITGADRCVCPGNGHGRGAHAIADTIRRGRPVCLPRRCVCQDEGAHAGAPLHQVVQWFKTMTTNGYIRGVNNEGWQPFNCRLWQRNYHEHIIRNEAAYLQIVDYIRTNPQRWLDDKYHM